MAEPEREWTRLSLVSESAQATEALAAALGSRLVAGDVVALSGELGSGKTCFVRGLALGLGVEGPVSSPTFTLMHVYPGAPPLYHFDAWMRGRGEAFLEDGGASWLGGEGIAAVEWADRVEPWLPSPRIDVLLSHLSTDRRRIDLAVLGPEGAPPPSLAARLAGMALPSGVAPATGPSP